jgi:Protein of unknown function (DUF5131)
MSTTPTDRIFIPWDWRTDPEAPYHLPQDRQHVVLVEGLDEACRRDDGPSRVAARAMHATAGARGTVFVLVETVETLAALGHREPCTDIPARIIPALRFERMADHDGDGMRALCAVQAEHRALVVSPREKLALGLPGVVPKAWGLGSGYNLVHDFVDLVIVQGPTGADAWPMHPTWVREIRDECADGVAAFTFTGWGDFIPQQNYPPQIDGFSKRMHAWLAERQVRHEAARRAGLDRDPAPRPPQPEPEGDEEAWWKDGTITDWGALDDTTGEFISTWTGWKDSQRVCRVGVEKSGRLLDGREHLDLPEGLHHG